MWIINFFKRLFKKKEEMRCVWVYDIVCYYPNKIGDCPKDCPIFKQYRIHLTTRLPSGKYIRKLISAQFVGHLSRDLLTKSVCGITGRKCRKVLWMRMKNDIFQR